MQNENFSDVMIEDVSTETPIFESSRSNRAMIQKLNLKYRNAIATGRRYEAQVIEKQIRELLIQENAIKR